MTTFAFSSVFILLLWLIGCVCREAQCAGALDGGVPGGHQLKLHHFITPSGGLFTRVAEPGSLFGRLGALAPAPASNVTVALRIWFNVLHLKTSPKYGTGNFVQSEPDKC